MFAIGNSLKEAREKTGVSLEEASADIQIKSVFTGELFDILVLLIVK